MQISVIGMVVVLAILVFSYFTRTSLVAALLMSLAFGSTSAITLTSLGGSSPLIYTIFAVLFLLSITARRDFWADVGTLFGRNLIPWIVCGLIVYTVISAMFFPRFFAGQTTVFVASHERNGVFEAPLAPVSGNITQAAYLVLGALVFLAVAFVLQHKDRLTDIRRGFFFWATANALMGVTDLAGKIAGIGDVLLPIRTANYALLTHATQGNFWRIAGAQTEASSFASASLASLAFTYSYWRATGDRYSFWLSLLLVVLLVLSTSSTAYAGLAILSVPVGLSIMRSFFSRRLEFPQIMVVTLFACSLAVIMFAAIAKPDSIAPFERLFNDMLLNKLSSSSGQERIYWNYKSLQSFVDTLGLGVGVGSSRASSWPIAVLSQMGLVGFVLVSILVARVFRAAGRAYSTSHPEDAATVVGVRNCTFAFIVAKSLSGGTADPGMIFFISLAVIAAYDPVRSLLSTDSSVHRRDSVTASPFTPEA